MSAENVEVVKQLYAAFFRRDASRILELTAAEIEVEQSREVPWGGVWKGHEGLQKFFAELARHLENRALPIERYLDAGDCVVAIGRTQGVVRANGKGFDVPLAHVWEVRSGKAVRFRPYIDNPTMVACLS
jgi:ketosteroid isomerase-like protein